MPNVKGRTFDGRMRSHLGFQTLVLGPISGTSVLVDLASDSIRPGDLYILCSDGLSGEVEDPDILRLGLAHMDDVDAMCREMIKSANQNGGKDNVTVLCVKVV